MMKQSIKNEKQEMESLARKQNKTDYEKKRLGKLLKKYYGIEPLKYQGIKEY